MKLFPDQEEVVYGDQGIYWAYENGHTKVCLRAATGFGKTVVMVHVMKDVVDAGGRALLLVPLDQLRRQARDSALTGGLSEEQVACIGVDKKPDLAKPIVITSVQTVARRKELLSFYKWDLILLDEVHVTGFARCLNPLWQPEMAEQKVLGVTATPTRLKKTPPAFGDLFTHMAMGLPEAELMRLHRLCPKVRYYGFSSAGTIDATGVHTVRGDYDTGELEVASDRPELLQHCVEQWKRLAAGRRTLVFCVSINHARHSAEQFCAAGIPAAMVCSETPLEERLEIYRKLETGELLVLTSRDVLAVGFNSIHVSAICMCRKTKSLAVFLQQLGRGLRSAADKEDLIVLDQAGVVKEFGPAEAERDWSLRKGEEPKGAGGSGFPMRQCVECGFLMAPQVHVCPECGAEQPVKEKSIRTDELVELVFDKAERRQRDQIHRWIFKAMSNGYLQGWVAKRYEQKYGHLPPAEQWRGAIYGPSPRPGDAEDYAARWGQICRRKNRTWTVALTALSREFEPEYLEAQDLGALRQAWEVTYAAHRVI